MNERFWLVRHAATAWTGRRWCGSTDLPLSATGRRQAASLAAAISQWSVQVGGIWSSPAQRALDTARAIAAASALDIEVDEELREVDFGRAEGLTWVEISARLPALAERLSTKGPFVDWPAGEAADELQARSRKVLERLALAPESLIVVTHGGLARAILTLAAVPTADLVIAPAAVIEVDRRRFHD
jgi:broad specificity phosphatase PhoE